MDVELGDGGVCWGGDADPIQLLHSTMLARGWDSAVCRVLKHRAAARRPLHHECHAESIIIVMSDDVEQQCNGNKGVPGCKYSITSRVVTVRVLR